MPRYRREKTLAASEHETVEGPVGSRGLHAHNYRSASNKIFRFPQYDLAYMRWQGAQIVFWCAALAVFFACIGLWFLSPFFAWAAWYYFRIITK